MNTVILKSHIDSLTSNTIDLIINDVNDLDTIVYILTECVKNDVYLDGAHIYPYLKNKDDSNLEAFVYCFNLVNDSNKKIKPLKVWHEKINDKNVIKCANINNYLNGRSLSFTLFETVGNKITIDLWKVHFINRQRIKKM